MLHLFSFQTPILRHKKRKKCKVNSKNFTYDGLTFSTSFLLEVVKDEILNTLGRNWFSTQLLVNSRIFTAEFTSRVLNTVYLFSQLTHLEHINRRNTYK